SACCRGATVSISVHRGAAAPAYFCTEFAANARGPPIRSGRALEAHHPADLTVLVQVQHLQLDAAPRAEQVALRPDPCGRLGYGVLLNAAAQPAQLRPRPG